jgi:hypothetical protein
LWALHKDANHKLWFHDGVLARLNCASTIVVANIAVVIIGIIAIITVVAAVVNGCCTRGGA